MKSPEPGAYTLRLFTSSGEVLSYVNTGLSSSGTHEWPFTFISGNRRIEPGIYYLELNDGNSSATVKVLIP
ncbi:T9SS type A sorting domain-containing protein [Lentimicrobium sp.]|uniref:T9SS type A sorting domain-containing protein n=1 Tax=Lentimicrobium sp. TaxID=2034841 RepID=UPI00345E7E5C